MLALTNLLGGLWQGYRQGYEQKNARKLNDEERAYQLEHRRLAESDRQQASLQEQQNFAWQDIQRQHQQQQWSQQDSAYQQQVAQQGAMQAPLSDKLRAYLAEPESAKRAQLALDLSPAELQLAAKYPTAPAVVPQPSWLQLLPAALLPADSADNVEQPIEITPPSSDNSVASTPQKISWRGLPAGLSDEVKAGAYKNLLAHYFEEVASPSSASSYQGEKGQNLPLINPFSGKYLRVKSSYQLDNASIGNVYHASEGFRQRLANGQNNLREIPAAGEVHNITLPAVNGEGSKTLEGIAYPPAATAEVPATPTLAPARPKANKAEKIRQEMARYFENNPQANPAEANEYYQWLQRLLPEEPEMELPIYLNNQQIMLPISQVLKHPDLASPTAEEIKMTVQVPETGEKLTMTPQEAQAWYRARASQLFNYTLPNGKTVALTGSELARLYPVMW